MKIRVDPVVGHVLNVDLLERQEVQKPGGMACRPATTLQALDVEPARDPTVAGKTFDVLLDQPANHQRPETGADEIDLVRTRAREHPPRELRYHRRIARHSATPGGRHLIDVGTILA